MTMEDRSRLEVQALIVGYAMSRLDRRYLDAFQFSSWKAAFVAGAEALKIKSASLKNLRDEFDPFHTNPRSGWHARPLRASRQRVLGELCDVSDDALLILVRSVLSDGRESEIVVDEIVQPIRAVSNVAERLLTGRRAEEYFLDNCQRIIDRSRSDLIDLRFSACGYDFGLTSNSSTAIEVKGMKTAVGNLLFTDREWSEAIRRRDEFLLVVIGHLDHEPQARVIPDPAAVLNANCRYQTSISASWTARFQIDS